MQSTICVQDLIGYYTCHCAPGFYGRNCETDHDQCASNLCNNGGNCIVRSHSQLLILLQHFIHSLSILHGTLVD